MVNEDAGLFDSHKGQLEEQVTQLKVEVGFFENALNSASTLSDLQGLDYQALVDKANEIETTVDNVPDETPEPDADEEEEAGR